MSKPEFRFDGPEDARHVLVLAHGAGAPMDAPFLETIARGLAERGVRVVRFEFPFMQRRRREGRRYPPDREPVLHATWREVVATLGGGEKLAIGGKSLGGRMAAGVADDLGVRALVCLGYPFHPPGRPEKMRTAPLETIDTPTLIVQGTNDALGRPAEVARYALSPAVHVAWIPDGDHSLQPPRRSEHTPEQNLADAVDEIVNFLEQRSARP